MVRICVCDSMKRKVLLSGHRGIVYLLHNQNVFRVQGIRNRPNFILIVTRPPSSILPFFSIMVKGCQGGFRRSNVPSLKCQRNTSLEGALIMLRRT
jgi:hypothetical protein